MNVTREQAEDIHEILQNDRFKATGKLQAIAEVLYGPDGEYLEEFLSEQEEEDGEEDQ